MALIGCDECGREISDKAKTCPGCGAPVSVAASLDEPTASASKGSRPQNIQARQPTVLPAALAPLLKDAEESYADWLVARDDVFDCDDDVATAEAEMKRALDLIVAGAVEAGIDSGQLVTILERKFPEIPVKQVIGVGNYGVSADDDVVVHDPVEVSVPQEAEPESASAVSASSGGLTRRRIAVAAVIGLAALIAFSVMTVQRQQNQREWAAFEGQQRDLGFELMEQGAAVANGVASYLNGNTGLGELERTTERALDEVRSPRYASVHNRDEILQGIGRVNTACLGMEPGPAQDSMLRVAERDLRQHLKETLDYYK